MPHFLSFGPGVVPPALTLPGAAETDVSKAAKNSAKQKQRRRKKKEQKQQQQQVAETGDTEQNESEDGEPEPQWAKPRNEKNVEESYESHSEVCFVSHKSH